MKIRAAIVGVSGYTGGELLRLLFNHPNVEIAHICGAKSAGKTLKDYQPHLVGLLDWEIEEPDYRRLGESVDVVFFSTPHGVAMKHAPEVLKGGAKVVDLSADYRLKDLSIFEKYYGKHESPEIKGVYGLPEIHREEIKNSRLVANPGCYSTVVILALAPLVKENLIDTDHIVVDALSGSSGAGASPTEFTHHPTTASNVKPYSVCNHRHLPEIEQELSELAGKKVNVFFTPHLIPITRGILMTAHVFFREHVFSEDIREVYLDFYNGEPFVRLREKIPELNYVVGSNFCDIGFEISSDGKWGVVVSVIDNLIKGASGQAIQNMNIMFGIDEKTGLSIPPLRP
ncbi:MAG: N-acetyl-gamma-glutamyl-phosphate reductase [Candidatus Hadarchaeales archaeon]